MEKQRKQFEELRMKEQEVWRIEQEKQKQAFEAERQAWLLEQRKLTSAVASGAMQLGTPPESGGAAAGVTPSTQDLEPDGRAAAQG